LAETCRACSCGVYPRQFTPQLTHQTCCANATSTLCYTCGRITASSSGRGTSAELACQQFRQCLRSGHTTEHLRAAQSRINDVTWLGHGGNAASESLSLSYGFSEG